jgi:glycosidase
MDNIAQYKNGIHDFIGHLNYTQGEYPNHAFRLMFTSNHDENSWNGTEFERLNQYAKQMAALTFVLPGMPLIYNGQEVGFNRRLNFFEKDSIEWKENIEFTELYKGLIKLRINNPALSSIKFNGFREIHIPGKQNIFAFARESGGNSVVSIFNFTSEQEEIQLTEIISNGEYMEFPIDLKVKASDKILIDPYGYKIYSK